MIDSTVSIALFIQVCKRATKKMYEWIAFLKKGRTFSTNLACYKKNYFLFTEHKHNGFCDKSIHLLVLQEALYLYISMSLSKMVTHFRQINFDRCLWWIPFYRLSLWYSTQTMTLRKQVKIFVTLVLNKISVFSGSI